MKKEEEEENLLKVSYPNSAGIDIGSRSHWVAVGQKKGDVKEFGVYSKDHEEMCEWLKEKGVTHIAMESTGTYWQNLYSSLVANNFDVMLVDGRQTRNISGKKSDIQDCQWIQYLYSRGILSPSFLPDRDTDKIRTYARYRANIISQRADCVRRMQQGLRLMNMRLDIVVSDIIGETGRKIIEAFLGGETDGEKLAVNRNPSCRKKKEEIAAALQYNGRKDHAFTLQLEWNTYLHLQEQLKEIDRKINEVVQEIIANDERKKQQVASAKPHKRKTKNGITGADMNQLGCQYLEGVDLMAIEGVSDGLIMSLISEVGLVGIEKFKTAKHFTSWVRLAPNNKQSGRRVLSNRVPSGSSRLKMALRHAANAIGNLKQGWLVDFFRRICSKQGRVAAITAVARKLAVIIWNMLTKRQPYKPPADYLVPDEKIKQSVIKKMKKQIDKFGINSDDLGMAIA